MVAVLTSSTTTSVAAAGPMTAPTTGPGYELPSDGVISVGSRPTLRVIDGGRAPRRAATAGRTPNRVYLRRRIIVGLVAVVALVVLAVGVQAVGSLLAAPATPTASTAAVGSGAVGSSLPIGATTYVVRPGDTLWSIASRLDPDGDPRPLVDALSDRAGSASLESGQRIDVSGLGA
jgi:LysM repeat protein